MPLIEEELSSLLTDNSKISWKINKIDCDFIFDMTRIKSDFYYLDFIDGRYDSSIFINYLSLRLIYFCLPKKEINDALQKFCTQEERTDAIIELHQKAKELFIQVHKLKQGQAQKAGEPAEFLLYIFLETFMKAPQIVAKMALKTNSQIPVYGSDGIHIGYQDGVLSLYFGEAKLYKDCSSAISAALKSISAIALDPEKQNTEINLINRYSEIDNLETKNEILDYLNPYSQKNTNMRIVFSCFIGFDFCKYSEIKKLEPNEVKEFFEREYKNYAQNICNMIQDGIKKADITDFNVQFFLLPFPSVMDFRKAFYDKIGMSYDFE